MKALASSSLMPSSRDGFLRSHAVEQAEIDGLGLPAFVRGDGGLGLVEEKRGRAGVDVRLAGERGAGLFARKMGQYAQFDLQVVRRHQQMPRRGHETFPHPPAEIAPDGDVLQVGVGAGKPPGGRGQVVEGGVDAAVRIGQLRQRFEMVERSFSGLQVFQDAVHQRMPCQPFQHFPGRCWPRRPASCPGV